MILTLDIETLPTTDADVIAALESTIKPPATHKKQETIDAWMAENKEQALKDLIAKTSFDGLYGSIACICWAAEDGNVYSIDTISCGTEKLMLDVFYKHISDYRNIIVCGHNVAAFDLPFLKHRSIINGVKPSPEILGAMYAKPWDSCIADTMLMWSSDSQKRASMDKLCKALGIAGKGDFDGSMVAETWPVDPQKVIDYCKDDVARTRAIYKRLTFA